MRPKRLQSMGTEDVLKHSRAERILLWGAFVGTCYLGCRIFLSLGWYVWRPWLEAAWR